MKKVLIILSILMIAIISQAAEDRNSVMRQEGNRGVVRYDLVGDAGEDAEVNLSIEYKGKRYSQDELSITGDIGKVVTGKNKAIFWDVLKDFPRGLVGTVDWFLDVGGKVYKDPVTGMEFVFVKGGCYQMGSNSGADDEKPVHEVCVDDFYIGKYEVTNAQFRKYQSGHNSKDYEGHSFNGDNQPAVYVSWDDAKGFINWLNSRSDGKYRLPTETEWEYAARGGTTTDRFWGNNPDDACRYANVKDKVAKREFNWSNEHNCDDGYAVTAPVGSFEANAFGLYDMLGNVWEWVEDIYSSNAYSQHQRNNPIYTGSGSRRVFRGGCWVNEPGSVRSAVRHRYSPGFRDDFLGLRLARPVK